MDYYKELEIERSASDSEIKAAYRKLVMQYHPDRCPGDEEAADKFLKIQESYEVLSDKAKKNHYDRYGEVRSNGFHQQGNFNDIFNFFNFGHQASSDNIRHIQVQINIEFMQAVLGCSQKLQFNRNDPCGSCKGTGAKEGTAFEQCSTCKGQGKIFASHSFIKLAQTCHSCGGRGKTVVDKCETCFGNGHTPAHVEVEVKIPAGSFNGMRMCVKGEGEATPSGQRGDLYVILGVQQHKYFGREEENLLLAVPITYTQSVLGCEIEVPGLNGKLRVTIPAGTQSGSLLRLKGQGINDPYYNSTRGDYIIRVDVESPTTTDEEYLKVLKQLSEQEAKHKSAKITEFERIISEE